MEPYQPIRLILPKVQQPTDAHRRFVAQLTVKILLTLALNARWYNEIFSSGNCRRCNEAEETWENVVRCRQNDPDAKSA